ncbi:hypothetical protein BYT27DRAFT_7264978 [Phlegmacium glaucopus]|nr:hypothetical protein BYT27DRAFT_7264978 [Phlegmacium glaucopus]
MFPADSWEGNSINGLNNALPISSDHHHHPESARHFNKSRRPTTSPNHSCSRNPTPSFNDLNSQTFMSYNSNQKSSGSSRPGSSPGANDSRYGNPIALTMPVPKGMSYNSNQKFSRPGSSSGANDPRYGNPIALTMPVPQGMSYNSNQKSSGSSRPGSSSGANDSRYGNPITLTMPVPKGRVFHKPSSFFRRAGIESLTSSSPMPENFELQLRPRTSAGDNRSIDPEPPYTRKPSFVWPFHAQASQESGIGSQVSTKDQSSLSLSDNSSQYRVVGRGGSGSRLRQQAASSNSAGSESNVPRPSQPPKPGFHRPTGRGGAGSSSKTVVASNPPTSLLDFLRGHKPSQTQRTERRKNLPPSIRAQSPAAPSFTISNHSRDYLDDNGIYPLISPTSEGVSLSNLRDSESDNNSVLAISYIEEEEIYPITKEQRQRNIDKLARTLGALPSPLMEGRQSSPVSNYSPITFSNPFSRNDSKTLLTAPLDDKFKGQRSSRRHFRSSDDLSQSDLADDSYSFSLEDDAPHSPITFAPLSPTKAKPLPLPLSDDDSGLSTPTSTGGRNSASLTELSLPSPTVTHIHVPEHLTPRSVSPPYEEDPPQSPTDGITVKSNWLVPLSKNNDEIVISAKRTTGRSKPRSWTGEWNTNMQDVIRSLRELR